MSADASLPVGGAELPGFGELAWLSFMQPVTLHRRLRQCGIGSVDVSTWQLWRAGGPDGNVNRAYVRGILLQCIALPPTLAFAFVLAFRIAGYDAGWPLVALGIAGSISFGIVLSLLQASVSASAAGVGAAFGAVAGVVAAGSLDVAGGVPRGTAFGLAFGVYRGVATATESGVAGSVRWGVTGSFAFGMFLGLAFGLSLSVSFGVAWGVAAVAGAVVSTFRLHVWPIEAVIQSFLIAVERASGTSTLRWIPVLHNELSYLPHPFLASHIVMGAERSPVWARRAIDACAIAPGQRRAGIEALARLQALELADLGQARDFAAAVEMRGQWLSDPDDGPPALRTIRDAVRYLAAAHSAAVPYHQLDNVRRAIRSLNTAADQLAADRSPLGRALPTALSVWRTVADTMLVAAEAAAANVVVNPFRWDTPLTPESGAEVFRGRDEQMATVRRLIAHPRDSVSLALLGPRRCGKSSLLRMLPAAVPDAVCVFFDLQDNPADSPAGFFRVLAERTSEAIRKDGRLASPALGDGPPFETARAWLEAVDERASEHDLRVLICIDEFERLETLWTGTPEELVRLMGLFRAIIQHRRHLRLLVSGAAPFDELSPLWYDNFINVREVRLGFLDHAHALSLLTRPIPAFPTDAMPQAVAERVFERTAGQPMLLQLFASQLIERINDADRRVIELADVDSVEPQVIVAGGYYFRDAWNSAPPGAQADMTALANGEEPKLAESDRRWLEQRLLISVDGQLSIPILGAWIRQADL